MSDATTLLTVKELSERVKISAYTIRKYVRDGIFPAYRISGKNYYLDYAEIISVIKGKGI